MSEPYKNAKPRKNYDRQFRLQVVEPEPRKPQSHRERAFPPFSSTKRVAFVWASGTPSGVHNRFNVYRGYRRGLLNPRLRSNNPSGWKKALIILTLTTL